VSQSAVSDRDHALDATRAAALLLGVLFHAAWSFVPRSVGAPVIDRAANEFFGWFFFASHTFRMQLFFLIAGFFGRLLLQRKRYRGFAAHRFKRIAVPLVVGWLILFPFYLLARAWCVQIALGRPFQWQMVAASYHRWFVEGQILIPRSEGGAFGLAHLWFLYFLLWFYGLTLLFRFLTDRFFTERAFQPVDVLTAHVMTSPWSVVWLSPIFGIVMYFMDGWFGVTTPLHSLIPFLPSFLLYGAFFAFGWILHRQANLLRYAAHRWKWQLPVGIAFTVVLSTVFAVMTDTGRVNAEYPRITASQIKDWPAFLDRLRNPDGGESHPVLHALRERVMRAGNSSFFHSLSDRPSRSELERACSVINRALDAPLVAGDGAVTGDGLLSYHRKLLEAALPGILVQDPETWVWYRPIRVAYSVGYALTTWLLVLGSLNLFQDRFPHHSPVWRYLADSSYWVYLIHLPVVVALQGLIAPWMMPAILKFSLLLFVSGILLFGSYHYLVRSTFIGKALNGRAYPFRPWPFSRCRSGSG